MFTEIIATKRDGKALSTGQIAEAIHKYVRGDIPDYQMAALLMACFLRGLGRRELRDLAQAMIDSGERYDLRSVPGMKIDKHSTGGVGDKISIILAPMVAAAGGVVPMIAGRGLGHTGGTIDKLESIPGFNTGITGSQFRRQLERIGVAIAAQSKRLVPADRKLYALRDVTGTVESIPLIAASILSKKVAAGNEGLVMDVKTGSGAFISTPAWSLELARTLVSLGGALGLKTVAYLTDMSQPLGRAVGNALEINECVDALQGHGPDDVMALTIELAARMLVMGHIAGTMAEGRRKAILTIEDGSAYEKFLQMVEAQGGDARSVADTRRLPIAPVLAVVKAMKKGYVARIDTHAVGLASVALGAGRQRLDEKVDPGVGITQEKKLGDQVKAGEAIFRLCARRKSQAEDLAVRLKEAVWITEQRPVVKGLIHRFLE